jgi:uncharacterized membrane protein
MRPELPGLVAALSEGQRAIAHLLVVLGLVAVIAAVLLVRRVRGNARRPRAGEETPPVGEEER